jgi:hypothetical protein
VRVLPILVIAGVAIVGLTACGEINEAQGQKTARICDIANNGDQSFKVTVAGGNSYTYKSATPPPDVIMGQAYTFNVYAGDISFGVANYTGVSNIKPAPSDQARYLPDC